MEAARTIETLMNVYQTTRCNNRIQPYYSFEIFLNDYFIAAERDVGHLILSFLGSKGDWRLTNDSLPSVAEVMNLWNWTSTASYAFMVRTKQMDNSLSGYSSVSEEQRLIGPSMSVCPSLSFSHQWGSTIMTHSWDFSTSVYGAKKSDWFPDTNKEIRPDCASHEETDARTSWSLVLIYCSNHFSSCGFVVPSKTEIKSLLDMFRHPAKFYHIRVRGGIRRMIYWPNGCWKCLCRTSFAIRPVD